MGQSGAPREECRARVAADNRDSPARRTARLNFIDSADDGYFEEYYPESVRKVLGSDVGRCRQCFEVNEVSQQLTEQASMQALQTHRFAF